MRECLLECVEDELRKKTAQKKYLGRFFVLGDVLRAKRAAKRVTGLAKLKLKAKGLLSRRHGDHCCC